jgi:hypothetical protein
MLFTRSPRSDVLKFASESWPFDHDTATTQEYRSNFNGPYKAPVGRDTKGFWHSFEGRRLCSGGREKLLALFWTLSFLWQLVATFNLALLGSPSLRRGTSGETQFCIVWQSVVYDERTLAKVWTLASMDH